MKRFTAVLLALTLLAAAIPFTPGAAAATWTSTDINSTTSISTNDFSTRTTTASSGCIWTMWETSIVQISRSCGGSTSHNGVFNAAVTWRAGDIRAYNSTLVIACAYESTNSDVYFSKTTNGLSWITPVLVASTGTIRGCSIDYVDASTYWILVGDLTNTKVQVIKSTDAGVTWGSAVDVQTSVSVSSNVQHDRTYDLDFKDATHAVAGFQTSTSVQLCYTVTGSSWSCPANSLFTNQDSIDLDFVSGNEYEFVMASGTNNKVKVGDSGDNGATWSTVEPTISGGFPRGASIAISSIDQDKQVLAWGETLNAASPVHSLFSSDHGLTWSAQDNVVTYSPARQVGPPDIQAFASGDAYMTIQECSSSACASSSATWKVRYFQTSFASANVAADHTVSVTNLNGFEIDPTGGTAVARTNLGDKIHVYTAQTLVETTPTAVDTNCDLADQTDDMVMAQYGGHLVGFVNCDNTGDPQYLSIRGVDGDIPSSNLYPDDCPPGSDNGECPYNIGLSDFIEPGDSHIQSLRQIQDFPIDYSVRTNDQAEDRFNVAWGFSSDDGFVGLDLFTRINGFADPFDANQMRAKPYSSGNPTDYCVGIDNHQYYIAAADLDQNVQTWNVDFDQESGPRQILDATITADHTFTGIHGIAVACGGPTLLIATSDDQLYWVDREGAVLDSITTGINTQARGVAISNAFTHAGTSGFEECNDPSGCLQYAAYYDGIGGSSDLIHVLNLSRTSDTAGTITVVGDPLTPCTSFFSLEMDIAGQFVWEACTNEIDEFDVHEATTTTRVGPPSGPPIDTTPDDVTPTTGLLNLGGEPAGDAIGNALGVGPFGGNLILASTTILGMTMTGGTVVGALARYRSIALIAIGAGAGLVCGFLIAWGFHFLSDGAVFATVIIGILLLAAGLFALKRG